MRARTLILNVDDDVPGRYAVGRTLKQAGYEVHDAGSGAEALKMIPSLRPDMVLLDVRMPDIDGFEVCRRIREQDSDISATAVIQMSASYVDTTSRVRGLTTGADAYLTEPVEPAILIATIESVLRIRRAEQQVRRSAVQWKTTFEAIRDGVALLDSRGNVVRSNERLNSLMGSNQGEIEEGIRCLLNPLRSGLGRQTVELTLNSRTMQLTLDPVLTDGSFDGAVCVLADITERKQFEDELRETAKLESVGVLAGGIAHDFNNLLTGIMGNAGLLMENIRAGTADRQLLDEIVKASESAADLTRQVLAYAGKGRFVRQSLNLTLIALETRAFVRRFVPARVQLVYDTDPNLPPIEGDPGQMQQIIMNLVINAVESFGESGAGTVTVTTAVEDLNGAFFRASERAAPGRYARLTVADTGSGMDEATQRRIFEPFFTTKFAGRGLGLSAVHGILKTHEGYMRLESKAGQGTRFDLYLPVSASEMANAPAEKAENSRPGHGTVLFVDDESIIRHFATAALRKRGYEVIVAENGAAAVELFRKFKDVIGLVILDFAMPIMTGQEAFEHIRRLSPTVPIIVSSGFSESDTTGKFKAGGVLRFLSKPYTALQLAAAVDDGLAGSADPGRQSRQEKS